MTVEELASSIGDGVSLRLERFVQRTLHGVDRTGFGADRVHDTKRHATRSCLFESDQQGGHFLVGEADDDGSRRVVHGVLLCTGPLQDRSATDRSTTATGPRTGGRKALRTGSFGIGSSNVSA